MLTGACQRDGFFLAEGVNAGFSLDLARRQGYLPASTLVS